MVWQQQPYGAFILCAPERLAVLAMIPLLQPEGHSFYGILFMLLALPFMDFHLQVPALLQSVNLANIIYLGIGASAICFVTWNYAVKSLVQPKPAFTFTVFCGDYFNVHSAAS